MLLAKFENSFISLIFSLIFSFPFNFFLPPTPLPTDKLHADFSDPKLAPGSMDLWWELFCLCDQGLFLLGRIVVYLFRYWELREVRCGSRSRSMVVWGVHFG